MFIKIKADEPKLDFKEFIYVTLPQDIYAEMMRYVEKFDGECSGCGLITEVVHDDCIEYVVSEIFLPEVQDNSGASTEFDGEETAKILTDCVQKNKITNTTQLRFHWHSHKGMEVFHSSTDEDNYDDIKCGDWLVSMVVNSAKDILASLHYYKPMRFDVDSIPVYIETTTGEEEAIKRADENFAKVKPATRTYTHTYPAVGAEAYNPAYSGYDEHYYKGNADDRDIEDLMEVLPFIEHSGEWECLRNKAGVIFAVKRLTDNKVFELSVDEMQQWEVEQELMGGYVND